MESFNTIFSVRDRIEWLLTGNIFTTSDRRHLFHFYLYFYLLPSFKVFMNDKQTKDKENVGLHMYEFFPTYQQKKVAFFYRNQ